MATSRSDVVSDSRVPGSFPGKENPTRPGGCSVLTPGPECRPLFQGGWGEAPRAGGGGRGGDLGQPGTGRLQAAVHGLISAAAMYFEQKGGKGYRCHADRGRLRRAMNYWSFYLLS